MFTFSKKKELSVEDYILDSCKATPGFEFFPKSSIKIDLEVLLNKFKLKKLFIEKNSVPFFITIKYKDAEITIFSSLKFIIKNINEENLAKSYLSELLIIVNNTILQR